MTSGYVYDAEGPWGQGKRILMPQLAHLIERRRDNWCEKAYQLSFPGCNQSLRYCMGQNSCYQANFSTVPVSPGGNSILISSLPAIQMSFQSVTPTCHGMWARVESSLVCCSVCYVSDIPTWLLQPRSMVHRLLSVTWILISFHLSICVGLDGCDKHFK